jgi:hypothetical protein
MSITDSVLKANAAWKDSIISIMRNVYWLVKENVPMRKCESLCALMGMQGFPLGRKYVNAKAARDFLRSIAHVIRNEIIRAAVMSPCLGLMIDESTDISHTSQMILYLRLLLCGCFQTVFWRIISVGDASADGLVETLNAAFDDDGIPKSRVVSFASDGASVLTGAETVIRWPCKRP